MSTIQPTQLGKSGKEGTVFIEIIDGVEYARKEFKPTKSFARVKREADYQKLAATEGVAPSVIHVTNKPTPSITMEKMDGTIIDLLESNGGKLTDEQQLKVLSLYRRLDEIGILHNDSNPLNLMYIGDTFKLIDYGFTKKITKKHCENPNLNIGMKLLLHSMNGLITRKLLIDSPKILLKALENKNYIQDS